jgi:hypothetical protein
MSHWAEIDENNIVLRVLVGDERAMTEQESYQWLLDNFGGTWVQTSYNTYGGVHKLGGTPLRKNYAGIGFTYDVSRDAFIPPKPYTSWLLDEETCTWKAPIPKPNDTELYVWDNDTDNWRLLFTGN